MVGKSVVTLDGLSTNQILDLLHKAEYIDSHRKEIAHTCDGRVLATLFYEPSTRTRLSFETAMLRLGGKVIGFAGAQLASVTKGESIADTLKTVSNYVDVVAIRHPKEGAALVASRAASVPVINAGDGKHQHPTQAMLDLYTMRKNFGHLDGLKVAIVGDLSHSRVCGSLVPALKAVGADVTLVGPPTFQVDDPDYFGVPQTADFDSVIPEMDVVYMLRVQLERMEGASIPSRREYNRLWGLDMARVNKMRPEAIICHPGPMNRGMEINADVADCARSRILTQVNAGVLTRMAEMYLLLGGENNGISA